MCPLLKLGSFSETLSTDLPGAMIKLKTTMHYALRITNPFPSHYALCIMFEAERVYLEWYLPVVTTNIARVRISLMWVVQSQSVETGLENGICGVNYMHCHPISIIQWYAGSYRCCDLMKLLLHRWKLKLCGVPFPKP